MKKKLILTAVAFAGLLFASTLFTPAVPVHSSTSGAPAGKTGSPGDGQSCTQCHSGTATAQQNLITTNIPAGGYAPNYTYQVTATVAFTGRVKFGFQVSPQNASGTKIGDMVATNTTETQTQSTGKYITHRTAGTSGTDGRTWTFDWKAPASGSGPVTFYGAFNCTNNLNNSAGDVVYLSNITYQEDLTSIREYGKQLQFNVFPSPAVDEINLIMESNENISAEIFGIDGKRVKSIQVTDVQTGVKIPVDVKELASGVYFVRVESAGKTGIQKFVKQ
jgi:hypothetical protein